MGRDSGNFCFLRDIHGGGDVAVCVAFGYHHNCAFGRGYRQQHIHVRGTQARAPELPPGYYLFLGAVCLG